MTSPPPDSSLRLLACDGGVTLAMEPAAMHGEDGQHPVNGNVRSLVLRAWLEPHVSRRLRIRIVEIDPGLSERPVVVTASVDDACRAVRRWLEALQVHDVGGRGQ
jgi:hypothetical protein